MIKVTQRDLIKSIPGQLRDIHQGNPDTYMFHDGRTLGELKQELSELELGTCPAEAVDAVMRNKSWTMQRCDECGSVVDVVVRLGHPEPDYDEIRMGVCQKCLVKALLVIQGEEP